MLRHADIWQAIDRLAHQRGMTPSGLARRAGLDPTTFNKSKRVTAEGKMRWPSTESIAKMLDAAGCSMAEFASFVTESRRPQRTVPLIGAAQAGAAGFFDDAGYPVGSGWDEIPFPGVEDPHAYALEISGDSMLPAFRDGDVVVVSPSASVRRGDRVVVKTLEGEVMAKQLTRRTALHIDLASINTEHPPITISLDQVAWIARILWISQ
jgi:phage repressor protein C with HTH and peptisase S24 domain